MTVALVTCREFPDGDEDATLLTTALSDVGVAAEWVIWDDAGVDWDAYRMVVLRSTWNYSTRRAEFLAWASSVPGLRNPLPMVEWNTDKTYLRDVAAAGIPIVATDWAPPGSAVRLPRTGEFVLKPSVGAGSMGAGRFAEPGAVAHEHAANLHAAGRTVMIQPYMTGVDATGETALIYVDGGFSHAVTKSAMLPGGTVNGLEVDPHRRRLYVEEKISPATAGRDELSLGARVLGLVRERFGLTPLYLRVDLLPGEDGPVVIEVELTEPSLFLGYGPQGAEPLATAVRDALGS